MIHQLNKNNQIEVNGISAVLLDERAKPEMWVDTEDLTIPVHQSKMGDGWRDNPLKRINDVIWKENRYAICFKQPDNMEIAEEWYNEILEQWVSEPPANRLGIKFRQIFILKEKEVDLPSINETYDKLGIDYSSEMSRTPLTKEYSMNEIPPMQIDDINITIMPDANKEECIIAVTNAMKSLEKYIQGGHIEVDGLKVLSVVSSHPSVKPIPDGEGKSLQDCKDEAVYRSNLLWKTWDELEQFLTERVKPRTLNRIIEDIAQSFAQSQSLNPWVSFSSGIMPRHGRLVIMCHCTTGEYRMFKYDSKQGYWLTHWMYPEPLPESHVKS